MRGLGTLEWSSSMLDERVSGAIDAGQVAEIIGQLGAAIVVFDRNLRVLAWNAAATRLYKWPAQALGQRLRYRPDDLALLSAALDGQTTHVSTVGWTRDGHHVVVSCVAAPIRGDDGSVAAAIIVSSDRTAEVVAVRRARLQQRRQAVLLRLGRMAMQGASDADVVRTACRLGERLLPAASVTVGSLGADGSLAEVAGSEPLPELDRTAHAALAAWWHRSPANDHVVHAHNVERSGRTSVFLRRADDGEAVGVVAHTAQTDGWSAGDLQFLASITTFVGSHLANRRLAAALRARAMYDDLTGLCNRSHLTEVLGVALAATAGDGPRIGVLFLDVDHFKAINDRFGHKGGDAVLLEVAARLRDCAGADDLVARLGGDEFVVLVRAAGDADELAQVGERFMSALAAPFVIANRKLSVTASCGAALASGAPDAEEALRWADIAMYEAKRNGRAHVRRYTPELGAARALELQTDAMLRDRAAANAFEIAYRPRVALPGRGVCAIEARIGAAGLSSHSRRFLELADELGTSTAIVTSAVAEAVHTVHAALPPASGVRLVLQVPADMLGEPALAEAALGALQEVGLPASRLTLQAAGAGVFATDPSAIRPELVATGVTFAVTDLGAETTTLGGFLDPWAHEVLLADDLIANLGQHDAARKIAMAAVQLAVNFGMAVVANGVSDETQLEFLESIGVTAAQGPLWGAPMPGVELARWIAANAGAPPRGRA